jgi:hypothetical protein
MFFLKKFDAIEKKIELLEPFVCFANKTFTDYKE